MAARQFGGPGGRFGFSWNGPALVRGKFRAERRAAERVRSELEAYLKSTLHVQTGEMRDKSFVEIVQTDIETTLVAGSDAPHTAYHELGTAHFAGHPQLRQAMDLFGPRFKTAVEREVRREIGGG